MMKRFSYYLLILTILGGCASLQAKRDVLENTFYSSYPEIQIKVGSEFEYIGETKETKTGQAQDSTYLVKVNSYWYLFVQSDEQRVKKAVLIEIRKAATYWVSDIYGRVENYYDKGTCKLGGRNWQYCSLLFYSTEDRATNRFLTEQGYIIPQCFLVKGFSKVYGPKNNYLITIAYVEEPPTSDYACDFWKPNSEKPNSGLEYSQREYIEQFQKNAETSFKILELGGQKLPKTDLQQELEKESFKIASVPEGTAKVSLRTEPKKLIEKDIRKMFARYDFYDADLNWRGSFVNEFVDNGNGTITDKATGLMWQKSGSSRAKGWKRAQRYVKRLNKDVFAGYSDWRWPTIEELASLVEREKVNEVHIDPVFDSKQKTCWSADSNLIGGEGRTGSEVWIVNFAQGAMQIRPWSKSQNLINLYPQFDASFYIRAVRSVK